MKIARLPQRVYKIHIMNRLPELNDPETRSMEEKAAARPIVAAAIVFTPIIIALLIVIAYILINRPKV